MRKFNDEDRAKLVDELEKFLNTKLRPYELPNLRVRKLYSDDAGNFFCVTGGRTWQGIQLSMLKCLVDSAENSYLIIGVMDWGKMSVFKGHLKMLIENPELLGKPQKFDQVSFTIKVEGEEAYLHKIPYYKMIKIFEYDIDIQPRNRAEKTVTSQAISQPSISHELSFQNEYSIDAAISELFCASDKILEIFSILKRKRNIILQGPPGVGKTFMAKQLAAVMVGQKSSNQVCMIQFHQSYGYEEFIRGWRPKADGSFEIKDGVFLRFCERAKKAPEKPFVFLIDEINRGNLSRIFGETMLLIEADKRSAEYALELPHKKADESLFFIPENVFFIGMMNTADRSLAMVDYALRRRFVFFDVKPAFDSDKFKNNLQAKGVSASLLSTIVQRLTKVNKEIAADTIGLGPGYQIGHSFFCPFTGDDANENWYRQIIQYEILPLLQEYWFDKPDNVAQTIDFLLQDL